MELELDGEPCGYQVGGIEVAETPERWDDLERKHGLATSWGLESELISPQECAERVPILDPGKDQGRLLRPHGRHRQGRQGMRGDGPAGRGARREVLRRDRSHGHRGQRWSREIRRDGQGPRRDRARRELRGDVGAQDRADGRHECAARADAAPVRVDHAAGGACRGDERGRPSYPAPPGLLDVLPPEGGPTTASGPTGTGPCPSPPTTSGGTTGAKASFLRSGSSRQRTSSPSWQEARKMLPALERAEIDRPMNGLFSFTPDGGPLLGESREAKGFWIAEAVWITHAIGVGKVMAEWITDRRTEHGHQRRRRPPLRALRPEPFLHPGPQRAVVPGGLRHHPPPAADGGAAPPAHQPLLPAPEGARGLLPRGLRLGATAMVRGQRVAARRARGLRPRRVGRKVLVEDRRRRSPGHPRARGPLRHDLPEEGRGERTRRPGFLAGSHHGTARQARRQGNVHAHA